MGGGGGVLVDSLPERVRCSDRRSSSGSCTASGSCWAICCRCRCCWRRRRCCHHFRRRTERRRVRARHSYSTLVFFFGYFFLLRSDFRRRSPSASPLRLFRRLSKAAEKTNEKKSAHRNVFFLLFFLFSLSLSLSLSLSTKLRFVFSLVTAHSEKRRLQGLLFSFATLSLLFFSAVPLLPQLAPLLLSIFFSFSGSSSYSPAWPREVRE